MNILYNDTDITDIVQIKSCLCRETSGKRCDSLELVFENAEGWMIWGPKQDDRIRVLLDGYDSGIMYLNTVTPENGKYRILATSLKCGAREKRYRSFTGKTIEEIFRACAMESGMDYRLFGMTGETVIPYTLSEEEGCAAYLDRMCRLEGAALKCVNGRYAGIDILWAQQQRPVRVLELSPDQEGVSYRRDATRASTLMLNGPGFSVTATDTEATESNVVYVKTSRTACNEIQAARNARALLLDMNRNSETLNMDTGFDPSLSAMTRVDVSGMGDADGAWLIDRVEHELIDLKTTTRMLRCVTSIR